MKENEINGFNDQKEFIDPKNKRIEQKLSINQKLIFLLILFLPLIFLL